LKVRALQWLAQREHSRAELRQRLLRAASAPRIATGQDDQAPEATMPEPEAVAAEVETLLDWLEARRYLSDTRFVEGRVQVRAQRFGNLRIENELRQHGVQLDAASRQQLKDSELGRARELWQRKYGGQPATDAAGRVKQMRFLAGRGFSAEVVRKVVQGQGTSDDA
jgi:regulatory protein